MNTKKNLFFSTLTIAIVVGLTLSSCKTQKTATATTTTKAEPVCATTPTYTADIKPIIDGACGNSCHSAAKKAHQIDLSSYEGTKSAAADKSFLGAINQESGYAPMPRMHPKLDDATIAKITCWVKGGMN